VKRLLCGTSIQGDFEKRAAQAVRLAGQHTIDQGDHTAEIEARLVRPLRRVTTPGSQALDDRTHTLKSAPKFDDRHGQTDPNPVGSQPQKVTRQRRHLTPLAGGVDVDTT
jgi:hypothetical protein